jgi:hypothetical protein
MAHTASGISSEPVLPHTSHALVDVKVWSTLPGTPLLLLLLLLLLLQLLGPADEVRVVGVVTVVVVVVGVVAGRGVVVVVVVVGAVLLLLLLLPAFGTLPFMLPKSARAVTSSESSVCV